MQGDRDGVGGESTTPWRVLVTHECSRTHMPILGILIPRRVEGAQDPQTYPRGSSSPMGAAAKGSWWAAGGLEAFHHPLRQEEQGHHG